MSLSQIKVSRLVPVQNNKQDYHFLRLISKTSPYIVLPVHFLWYNV